MLILVYVPYIEMLKFENETNWANNVLGLWRDYNLPVNDDNINKMSVSHWKDFVKSSIVKEALLISFRLNSLQTERPTTLHMNIPL